MATSQQRDLAAENEELRARLEEAEETLRAIRSGEVDALVVSSPQGGQVYTLQGADYSYRALIEEMNEGALNMTPEGMILYANQRFANMLKTPLQAVIGSAVQSWISPDCQGKLQALLQQAERGKCREELTLVDGAGGSLAAYLSISPLSVSGVGDFLGVVATDLSEQKRMEQALRLSEAKFRDVFQNASLGNSLLSTDGSRHINTALTTILGYTEEDLKDKTWQHVTHPDDIEPTAAALSALMNGRLPCVRLEKRFIHKDGRVVWTDATLSLVRDAAGQPLYILTSLYDITPRKQADEALTDLKEHLQHYIEMERLHLAQDLHDVPLQELYSILYRLEDLRPKSPPQYADVIREVIEDIKQTLGSMRTIASELRPLTRQRLGLEKAARAYLQSFREKYPDIQVNASLASDGQSLPEAVRLVLLRVLQEACANVVRHAQATELTVRFKMDTHQVSLEIADNGKGFTVPADWTALERGGHYGLAGMSERVKAAGGTLKLISAPGASTTVRVKMPYVPLSSKTRTRRKTASAAGKTRPNR